MLFRGVVTPSLMPAGPDAQHVLGPPSMSVVIVTVIDRTLTKQNYRTELPPTNTRR